MHAYLRRGLYAALITSGGLLFAAGQASADDTTSGTGSVLGGNQVTVSVTAPITVNDNGIALLDDARVDADASRAGATGDDASQTTDGSESVAGGNQINAPVTAPITVGGNAVAVLDEASVTGDDGDAGGADGVSSPAPASGDATQSTDGSESVAGGNQVNAPVTAPDTVGGNAVAVLDDASVTGGADGASSPAPASGDATQSTDGSESVAGGNQVNTPVTAPITVGGNAVAVADEATVSDPVDPQVPGDGAGTTDPSTDPSTEPTPGTGGGAPGNAGQPTEEGPEAPGTTADGSTADSAVAAGVTAGPGVPVRAASAVPALAQTGFAGEAVFLGVLALLAGLGLLAVSQRSGASTRR
jgi:hypothetical protein